MSIEGLGRKFQGARKARNLSLEEAARLTRIRQSRLAEIEADDFSNFPSLAYAKGFLQIYGKFLEVDVSPYLDAFETSGHLTVDGYSYLQDAPAPKAPRRPVARRTENARPSLVPFLIGIAIQVAGPWQRGPRKSLPRRPVTRRLTPRARIGSTSRLSKGPTCR